MYNEYKNSLNGQQGFTLIEVVVVVAIIALVLAISVPSFLSWRENMQYRQVSSDLTAAVRDARSKAISRYKQHEVVLTGNSYTVRAGDRSVASAVWTTLYTVSTPAGVGLNSPDSRIIANPNGTLFFDNTAVDPVFGSSAVSIVVSVQNTAAVTRYEVGLSQIGKVSQKRIN
jgi:prepilin-type N-terminal cleavage/methylation domain-containing protein